MRRLRSRLGDLPADHWDQMRGTAGGPGGNITDAPGSAIDQSQQVPVQSTTSPASSGAPVASGARPGTFPQYRASAFAQILYTGTGQSIQILPGKAHRRYLCVQNTSASDDVYLNVGAKATAASFHLPAGAVYEPFVPPNGPIWLYSVAGATAFIFEGD